jgi:hypothetical protein
MSEIEKQDSVSDELECIIWNALDESMDYDWNTSQGAKVIISWLADAGVVAALEAQGWQDTPQNSSVCPKCNLKAETLLHKFCQHKDCPVRTKGDAA